MYRVDRLYGQFNIRDNGLVQGLIADDAYNNLFMLAKIRLSLITKLRNQAVRR
jgi:hypothetical protein